MYANDQTKTEHEVRQLAYAIWEREGRCHGRDLEHWLRAETMFRMGLRAHSPEMTMLSPPDAKKPAKKSASKAKRPVVKAASSQTVAKKIARKPASRKKADI